MRYGEGTGYKAAGPGTKALGIIGTSLGGIAVANQMNTGCGCNNGGLLGNLFGGNRNDCYETKEAAYLRAENAAIVAERYADHVGLGVYNEQIQSDKEIVAFVNTEIQKVKDTISANDKITFTALAELDKQAALNKQANEFVAVTLNNKIDCETDKIIAYVNGHFVKGELKTPLSSICPQAAPLCPDVQQVELVNSMNALAKALTKTRNV